MKIYLNGKPVETGNALTKLVALKRPGTTSTLEVYRQGTLTRLHTNLAKLEDGDAGTKP